jgi:uncharacterized membrane protein YbhN (UPF0104 family)
MVIAIFLFWVIYRDLNGFLSLSSWRNSGLNTLSVQWLWLALIITLAAVNWTLEALKWQILFNGEKSFLDALREVLVGVTSGLITPGRIGEYFGRYYVSKQGSLAASVSGTLISSASQNFFNVSVGILALCSFRHDIGWWPSISWQALVIILIAFATSMLLISSRWRFVKDWVKKIDVLSVSATTFSMVFLFSLFRYLIYSSQFALMFWALGGDVLFIEALTLVAIVYLIQSGLALPPFLAALARVEIALLIFSYHIDNELLIVGSTLLIWIINVIGPALLGWVYLLKTNRH